MWLNSLHDCRPFSPPNVRSDHRMVCAKLRLSLRASINSKRKQPKIDWDGLLESGKRAKFEVALKNRFDLLSEQASENSSVQSHYDHFLNSVDEVARKELGCVKRDKTESLESDSSKKLRMERNKNWLDVERLLNIKAKTNASRKARAEQLRAAKAKWRLTADIYSKSLENDQVKFFESQLEEMKRSSRLCLHTVSHL